MRSLVAALSVLLISGSVGWGADAPALRKLAKMPTLTFEVGVSFSFTRGRGLHLWWERPDLPSEIAALEKSLKGDAWDAERVHRIGELAREMDDDARAQKEFRRAIGLYRERLRTQTGSGLLAASLGQALGDAGEMAEAEKMLRDAIRVSPNEWRSRVLLAQFLESKALAILVGKETIPDRGAVDQLMGRAFSGMPPAYAPLPGALADAGRYLDEGSDCYDEAVVRATKGQGPAAARAYAERGTARGFTQAVLRAVLAQARGEKADARRMMLSPASLDDLRRAADLDPSSVRTVALAGLCEVFGFALSSGQPWDGVWAALPEESKAQVRRAMERLGRLAQEKDRLAAASALDALGVVAYVASDGKRAEESLRSAVKLDPSRERTWEMLAMIFGASGRYQDLVALCKERLATRDALRTRLLLAKAYEKLDQPGPAEEQVRAALRLAPQDFYANLGLAAILLRAGGTPAVMKDAAAGLAKADRACAGSASPEQWLEYTVIRGIHLGLAGDTANARACFQQILDQDGSNEDARQALAALGK